MSRLRKLSQVFNSSPEIKLSIKEELKFPLDIILRQIGHTEHKQGTCGHYDNTEFLPERRKFVNEWSLKLVNNGLKI